MNGLLTNVSRGDEVSRMRPKTISVEKEKLYEDSLKLKKLANELKGENMKLKAKVANLEVGSPSCFLVNEPKPSGKTINSNGLLKTLASKTLRLQPRLSGTQMYILSPIENC